MSATDQTVGRFGNTRTPISVEQIKQWLSLANTSVIVRPVLDLAGHQPVDSYEIPDRIARQVKLRDHHCVFPHCTRPAERCDLDHIDAHADSGVTCPCNLAPLCRGHHRLKTAGKASYRMLTPGAYHWTLPVGDLPGRPHRHPPPHRIDNARPARGVATQPRTPPHRRGYRHVQGGFEARRCAPRTSTTGTARSPSSLRGRTHSEHLKQRRSRAGPRGTAP